MYLPQSNAVCVHWTPMFFVPLWMSRSISGFHLQHVGNFRWRFFSCHVNSWLTRSHRIILGATMTFVHCIGLQWRAINDVPLSSWKLMSRQSYFSHWRQLQHVSFACSRTATMRRANKKKIFSSTETRKCSYRMKTEKYPAVKDYLTDNYKQLCVYLVYQLHVYQSCISTPCISILSK